jgi:hypothetical protein
MFYEHSEPVAWYYIDAVQTAFKSIFVEPALRDRIRAAASKSNHIPYTKERTLLRAGFCARLTLTSLAAKLKKDPSDIWQATMQDVFIRGGSLPRADSFKDAFHGFGLAREQVTVDQAEYQMATTKPAGGVQLEVGQLERLLKSIDLAEYVIWNIKELVDGDRGSAVPAMRGLCVYLESVDVGNEVRVQVAERLVEIS